MEKLFSHTANDKKAVAIAEKIKGHFPTETVTYDNCINLINYLTQVGKMPYIEAVKLINNLSPLDNKPFNVLRVAYALMHYESTDNAYIDDKGKLEAHAKILDITLDDKDKTRPTLCLKLLIVSSKKAGRVLDWQCSLTDCVKIQKNIYSGRSRKLAGRSLLELIGCLCTVKLRGDYVIYLSADKSEKKINKELCQNRTRADYDCAQATTCARCKKSRTECRLSVR